jgi:hypothetical protein
MEAPGFLARQSASASRRILGALRVLQRQWCATPIAERILNHGLGSSFPKPALEADASAEDIDAALLTCIAQVVYQLAICELASASTPAVVVTQLQCAGKALFRRGRAAVDLFADLDTSKFVLPYIASVLRAYTVVTGVAALLAPLLAAAHVEPDALVRAYQDAVAVAAQNTYAVATLRRDFLARLRRSGSGSGSGRCGSVEPVGPTSAAQALEFAQLYACRRRVARSGTELSGGRREKGDGRSGSNNGNGDGDEDSDGGDGGDGTEKVDANTEADRGNNDNGDEESDGKGEDYDEETPVISAEFKGGPVAPNHVDAAQQPLQLQQLAQETGIADVAVDTDGTSQLHHHAMEALEDCNGALATEKAAHRECTGTIEAIDREIASSNLKMKQKIEQSRAGLRECETKYAKVARAESRAAELERQCAEKEQQIKQQQEQILDLRGELVDIHEAMKQRSDANDALMEKIRTSDMQVNALQREIDDGRKKIDEMSNEHAVSIQQMTKNFTKSIEEVKKESEKEFFQTLASLVQTRTQSLARENEDLKKEARNSETMMKFLINAQSQQKDELQQLTKQHSEIMTQLQREHEEMLAAQNAKLESMTQAIVEKDAEVTLLRERLEAAQLERTRTRDAELETLHADNGRKDKKILEMRSDLHTALNAIETLEDDSSKLKQSLEKCNELVHAENVKVRDAVDQNQRTLKQLQDLSAVNARLRDEHERSDAALVDCARREQELRDEKEKLRSEHEQMLMQKRYEYETRMKDLDEARAQIETQVIAAREELESIRRTCTVAEEKCARQLADKDAELKVLQDETRRKDEAMSKRIQDRVETETNILTVRLRDCESQMRTLREKSQRDEQSLAKERSVLALIRSQTEEQAQQIRDLKTQKADLDQALSNLNDKFRETLTQNSKLLVTKQSVDVLAEERDAAERKCAELEKANRALEADRSSARAECANIEILKEKLARYEEFARAKFAESRKVLARQAELLQILNNKTWFTKVLQTEIPDKLIKYYFSRPDDIKKSLTFGFKVPFASIADFEYKTLLKEFISIYHAVGDSDLLLTTTRFQGKVIKKQMEAALIGLRESITDKRRSICTQYMLDREILGIEVDQVECGKIVSSAGAGAGAGAGVEAADLIGSRVHDSDVESAVSARSGSSARLRKTADKPGSAQPISRLLSVPRQDSARAAARNQLNPAMSTLRSKPKRGGVQRVIDVLRSHDDAQPMLRAIDVIRRRTRSTWLEDL